MPPIFVSGTSGFIGFHLSERLGSEFQQVDPRENIDYDMLSKGKKSTFIHLSGPSNKEEDAERKIIEVTNKIFSGVESCPWIDIIMASSIRVFGQGGKIQKNDSPIPNDGYGRGKKYAEDLFNSLDDGRSVDILRISNVQGIEKNGNARGVAGILCSQAVRGRITINGEGNSMKDIIHVTEVIDYIAWILENKISGNRFHPVGGNNITLNHLAELISSKTGAKIDNILEDPNDHSAWFEREYSNSIFNRNFIKIEDIVDELLLKI